VTARLAGTPAVFTAADRVKPLRRAMRLYLVREADASKVRTRFDRRLAFVAQIAPDRNVHGLATFTVPPLDSGDYVAAVWCPDCAKTSAGRTFFTLPLRRDVSARYQPLMRLHVDMPSATARCPVTLPRGGKPPLTRRPQPQWHGNSLLWTWLALDGTFEAGRDNQGWEGDPPGSIADKLYWFARSYGNLTVRGERLDSDAPPLVVHSVNLGSSPSWSGPTWATAVSFPSEGCWRLTARLGDVSLSYVMRVVRR
jgi:hypothetical protein